MKEINQSRAQKLAKVLQGGCYLLIICAVITAILVLMGQIEISQMLTPDGNFYDTTLRGSTNSTLRVPVPSTSIVIDTLGTGGKIDLATRLGVALIGLAQLLPEAYCCLLFARFFGNIANDSVFTADNASILHNCGQIQVISGIIVPILAAFIIPFLTNRFTANTISVGATFSFSTLFFGIVLLVVAYVFRYGLHLQDEADHTL